MMEASTSLADTAVPFDDVHSMAESGGSLGPQEGDGQLQWEARRLGAACVFFLVSTTSAWDTAWSRANEQDDNGRTSESSSRCNAEAHPLPPQRDTAPPQPRQQEYKVVDDKEVRRLKALLTKQQESQKGMMHLLQRVMLETFLDASHAEKYRALLERFLQEEARRLAVQHNISQMVVKVPTIKLPASSEGAPELTLKSFDDTSGTSIWGIRVTPWQVFCEAGSFLCFLRSIFAFL